VQRRPVRPRAGRAGAAGTWRRRADAEHAPKKSKTWAKARMRCSGIALRTSSAFRIELRQARYSRHIEGSLRNASMNSPACFSLTDNQYSSEDDRNAGRLEIVFKGTFVRRACSSCASGKRSPSPGRRVSVHGLEHDVAAAAAAHAEAQNLEQLRSSRSRKSRCGSLCRCRRTYRVRGLREIAQDELQVLV